MLANNRSRRAPKQSAAVFAALGDETRLRLVSRLAADGPLSVSALTDGSRVTRQAIAKHLQVLTEAGLVRGTREGRERIYELQTHRMEEARRFLDQISADWDRAIERLRCSRSPR